MLKLIISACLTTLILTVPALGADTGREKRVALVIGNGIYADLRDLTNPSNDAKAISEKLRAANFEVIEVIDAPFKKMRSAFRTFERQARSADVKLLFYAGHGIQVNRRNYILPTDAYIEESDDVYRTSLDLQKLINRMTRSGGINIVMLDSCRDNPFNGKTALTRSAGGVDVSGFTGMSSADADLMILFATGEGQFAADGTGDNSPFTSALIKHFDEPGLDFAGLSERVVRDVKAATGQKQRPWHQGSLSRSFAFHPRAVDPALEENEWADARKDNTVEGYRRYLKAFPAGRFADRAQNKIENIQDRDNWARAKAADSLEEYEAYLQVPSNRLHRREARLAKARLDNLAWKRAKAANTPAEIKAYLADERHSENTQDATDAFRKLDRAAWNKAEERNTVRAYRTYIRSWDDDKDELVGEYVPLARSRIKSLRERVAWSTAENEDSVDAYGAYLDDYPDTNNAETARKVIAEREKEAWDRAERERTAIRYRQYVAEKYFKRHRGEAQEKLQEAEASELWQKAGLADDARSATDLNISGKQKKVLERIALEYPATLPGKNAAKVLRKLNGPASPTYGTGAVARLKTPGAFGGDTEPLQGGHSGGQAAVSACDRLAANPDDRHAVGAGMPYRRLEPLRAVPACQAAVQAHPGVPRFKYQLARALQKAGDYAGAKSIFSELTEAGSYGAAFDNFGWMYVNGLGVRRSARRGMTLFRRGAELGDLESTHSLGVMMKRSGDIAGARRMFRQAASIGYARASRSLASLDGSSRRRRVRVRGTTASRTEQRRRSYRQRQADREMQQFGQEMVKGVFGAIVNKALRK
ncbi:MAG: caspase family protein [Pseudomonadota bacterium]